MTSPLSPQERAHSRLTPRRVAGALFLAAIVVAVFATIGAASSVTAGQAQYAPVNTVAPSISGTTTEGQLLTANEGSWTAPPSSYEYAWARCDAGGNACAGIASNATGKQYKLVAADVGKTIRVRVTAVNTDGKTVVWTAQTGAVTSAGPAGAIKLPSGETSIPVTSVSLANGNRLVITEVKFAPNPVRVGSKSPISVRVKVKDNRGYVVRGALVFLRSTPLLTSTPPEQLTQQDGSVTLTTVPQTDFPKNPAYNVQFFARARKNGDDPLGGVSTRTLVQVGLTR